jgi:hypothetical protein
LIENNPKISLRRQCRLLNLHRSGLYCAPVPVSQRELDLCGRLDNVMVERLWRTVKYEHVHLRDYLDVPALRTGLSSYFPYYNHQRWHQGLANRTPVQVLKSCP